METNVKVVGQKIVEFRPMTQEERNQIGWGGYLYGGFIVILENGVKIVASSDDEGNNPGVFFVN